jgi:predicted nucleotidyltransferase component of viral defense system
MIQEWLDSYQPSNRSETEQVLREVMQSVALAGLHRGNFFEKAAFYGGTALRIFHGLDRFSEDLDFTLITEQSDFDLTPYLDSVQREFDSLGLPVAVQIKAN